MRIAFAGTPEFALPALRALAAMPGTLTGVLTQPDRPAGRGRALQASAVKRLALDLGLPVAQPGRLHSPAEQAELRAWAPELLVVVAYGQLLPPAVLELPRLGCINIHASLLPRWRGAAPIQRAILAGDAVTGVTLMQMDAGLDTGPILAQRTLSIAPRSTAGELHDALAALGAAMLAPLIAELAAGRCAPRPQPIAGVSHAAKLEKSAARIDWTGSALSIDRQVRAFNPWPVAETRHDGEQLRIWRALPLPAVPGDSPPGTVLGLVDDRLRVATGAGVLAIEMLQGAGRRVMSAREFANARSLTGRRLG
ncbi:MAG: methionyl-tRNA formyltransferase [Gammaproteobacteria bacterium]|nr:methionyl-tRNA formyltransferase [Gammaproteobacteria bacterium]